MTKRKYLPVELFLRSLIFSTIWLITMCFYSLFVVFTFFMPLKQRFQFINYYLQFSMYLLKKICHIDYKVEGLEHLPKNQVGVVLSKHQSTWETLFLPLIFKEPAIIVKRELLWLPFFGWGLAAAEPIAIDRKKKSSAMQQIITKGKKCLDSGRWVLLFPEGTRVPYGTVGHYKLGGARLAIETGYPVIPVALDAGKYWARRKFIKQPGTVRFVIGPLIETKGLTAEEVTNKAKMWIEGTLQSL